MNQSIGHSGNLPLSATDWNSPFRTTQFIHLQSEAEMMLARSR